MGKISLVAQENSEGRVSRRDNGASFGVVAVVLCTIYETVAALRQIALPEDES
jgi:hypothetical protein